MACSTSGPAARTCGRRPSSSSWPQAWATRCRRSPTAARRTGATSSSSAPSATPRCTRRRWPTPGGTGRSATRSSVRRLPSHRSSCRPRHGTLPATPWFEKAAFAAEVFEENPDLDTPRVHEAVKHALDRLAQLPMVHGHLDYGLPNVLQAGVIDWQHHGPVPLGYDVYPALDIVAFKGGGKGYSITPEQRAAYTGALDETTASLIGQRVSEHLGDFLLAKCFFFLALMRPTDPTRHDKHIKWQYRRTLFTMGLDQYESSNTIDTGTFPTLERFTAEHR